MNGALAGQCLLADIQVCDCDVAARCDGASVVIAACCVFLESFLRMWVQAPPPRQMVLAFWLCGLRSRLFKNAVCVFWMLAARL